MFAGQTKHVRALNSIVEDKIDVTPIRRHQKPSGDRGRFVFDVPTSADVPSQTIEGTPGLVVLEMAACSFSNRSHEISAKVRGEPPTRIGLVADLTNPMWEQTVVDPRYQCLIPLNHFANPDGPKGDKTRAWFSINRQSLVAWAGICRNTPEFGPVFAGMTGEANEKVRPYNDRMPILLKREDYEIWLHGDVQDVTGFQFREPPLSDEFEILETMDRWQSGVPPTKAFPRKGNMLM
jgi:hypothetical protein